ncbi:flagellar basal-body MS-ring/collar protein FliF [Altererythrobacter sp. C41]|uniref:flagellar basal-body MS-ring/collar protein FliF n=1 Tax=Altererythrobacter sp. C41 TaxID=2806021 RepID=UPI00193273DA|nr:flagellar basal-body MS-ring/collar protein FliF [Altererythrobacter sp. C41]MBM0170918.1 flagellar M-ring protein FliF [Altererythrobacter sp. C41]
MSDLVPTGASSGSLLAPLRARGAGSFKDRAAAFVAQPAVRKALPWFAGFAAVGMAALLWAALAPAPQRVLYSSLGDADRAGVVSALETASIDYTIDNATGALTVGADDLYRARMVVASDGALATPETGQDLIDSLPMGASRTLEGDRLRAAQERDLMLTIREIDGVESVRVHLARAERSVFVRDNLPPTASVMVRMARGRQLSESQVTAIANLVAASVPGLSIDAVRIVDQHGRLLSDPKGAESDRLELQTRMEAKLRSQVDQLLAPMIGAENFSSEIQVALDMNEVTSARESYDKDGAVRRETTQTSTMPGPGAAVGVPGVLSNTPPAAPEAVEGAPEGGPAAAAAPEVGESSATRTYELGREVAVSNVAPGSVKRLSVAVAINQDVLQGAKPADIKKFEDLVAAAVGADTARGDTVAVIVRPFDPPVAEEPPFWEAPWFAMVVRNLVALICVVLVLLFVARPIVRALTSRKDEEGEQAEGELTVLPAGRRPALIAMNDEPDREELSAQIELAQRIAREQPDDALQALRRMLSETRSTEGVA